MASGAVRLAHSARGAGLPKHLQFEAELRAGRFAATEADLDLLDLPTHFTTIAIRDPTASPGAEQARARQLSRMRLYMSDAQCRGVALRSRERAERLARGSAGRFPALSANEAAVSRHFVVPPRMISGGRGGTDGIKRDIRQLQAELALVRAANARLERHVDLLAKAQETLAFEECALVSLDGVDRVALDFAKRRAQQQQNVRRAIQRLEQRAPLPA
jgi:hypothetical protein